MNIKRRRKRVVTSKPQSGLMSNGSFSEIDDMSSIDSLYTYKRRTQGTSNAVPAPCLFFVVSRQVAH